MLHAGPYGRSQAPRTACVYAYGSDMCAHVINWIGACCVRRRWSLRCAILGMQYSFVLRLSHCQETAIGLFVSCEEMDAAVIGVEEK